MSTHTPGPWSSDRNPIYSQWWISHDGGKPIATVKEETDGRLIAAAPDLLAALQQAISSRWLSIDFEHNRTKEACDIRAAICAAIARAEGTS